ncbi:serine hydrolase domain-containing protein [Salinispira pacifica]
MRSAARFASVGLLIALALTSCSVWKRIDRLPAASLLVEAQIRGAMRSARVPGLSAAVVTGGKVAWSGTFGVREAGASEKVDEHTVFEAASLGKPVFAYAVLRLASNGGIDLDRPLFSYWRYPDIAYDERTERITAAMVLSHTSGLENWRGDDELQLIDNPGDSFNYSGEAYLFLQKVVEQISGTDAESLVRKLVMEPFGMRDSFFRWRSMKGSDYAIGTDAAGNPVEKYRPAVTNVAGGFHTTADDYARFLTGVMRGEGLSAAVRARMTRPVVKLWIGKGADPDWVGWGLGFALQYSKGEGVSLWHWGDNEVFKSFMVAFPARGTAMVYLTNSFYGLAVRDRVVTAVAGGRYPAFTWMGYPQIGSASSAGSTGIAGRRLVFR